MQVLYVLRQRLGTAALKAAALFATLLTVTSLVAFPSASAQGGTDILRGRVLVEGKPVADAHVTATDRESGTSRMSTTGEDGRYTILIPNGSGEYELAVTAMGYKPAAAHISMPADEELVVKDIPLKRIDIALLNAITITGQSRPKAQPGELRNAGASEQSISPGVSEIIRSLDNGTGDLLSRLAATIPGVTLTPGQNGGPAGFSVLGQSPTQNNVTLDGTTFGGGVIPSDALGGVRLATTTYDPSRGNFSGGQLSATTRSGMSFPTRSFRVTLAEPSLTFADAATRAFQPPHSDRQISGTAGGPLANDKLLYFGALQIARQSSDATTLLDADNGTLQRSGIAPDSVTRVLQLLNNAGIPASLSAIPNASVNTTSSGMLRLDLPRSGTWSSSLMLMQTLKQQDGAGLTPLATPGRASESRGGSTRVQLSMSHFFHNGFLHEVHTSYDHSTDRSAPYLQLPGGSVLVSSALTNGVGSTTAPTTGLATLNFGGGSGQLRTSGSSAWEMDNELSWISFDNKHRYKLSTQLQRQTSRSSNMDGLGMFTYNSLDALEANIPAMFTRTFSSTNRSAGGTTFSASLGDSWRATNKLRFDYGVRSDIAWALGRPAYNLVVDSVFGARNDYVPRSFGFSPRFGFTYRIGGGPQLTRAQLRDQMARASASGRGPSSYFYNTGSQLRGGIGAFRGPLEQSLVTSAANATGLPGGTSQLICVGDAVPIAQWAQYLGNPELVPTECADGTSAQRFGINRPNVVVLTPGLQSPTSWRSNLGWQGHFIHRFNLGIEGTYSLGVNQQDVTDLNFAGLQGFTLANEGGRPVFVSPTAIVPTTGAIAPGAASRDTTFGSVLAYASGLRSVAKQLSVNLSPMTFYHWGAYSLSYVWKDTRQQTRGFNSNTDGDPRTVSWIPGTTPRHEFTLTMFNTLFGHLNFNVSGKINSGSRFTPMVAGDVNGDGRANDRAFIFDPADPQLGAAMQALMASSPGSIRKCLSQQIGRIAGRNSCSAPWTATFDAFASLTFRPKLLGPTHGSTQMSLQFINPLSGLDQLMGGALHTETWNRGAYTDPTLLYVRGFNSATNQFTYDVNPRFGTIRNASTAIRPPFTVRVEFSLNYMNNDAGMRRALLGDARASDGVHHTAEELRARYAQRSPNPYRMALSLADTMHLADSVRHQLDSLGTRLAAAIDTAWAPVAEFVTSKPNFDVNQAMTLTQATMATLQRVSQDAIATLRTILTPEQMDQLPRWVTTPTPPVPLPVNSAGGRQFPGRGTLPR